MYNVTSEKELITIGEAGENIAESCTIDFNDWIQQYGQGDLRIRAIRAGDKQPYPVSNVTVSDGVATWTYTEADTAIKGYGEVQILYYVGDVLSKSRVWQTYTHRSLSVPGEPPQPYDDWIRQVEESADEARDYAASALESANTAGEYKRGAEAAQEAAEIAQELTDQIKEEAKTAKIAAENARNAAQGYAAAAAQSAEQAEEAADSIEASADIIQKLLANQIHDTATGTIASFPDGADMPMVSLVADIDPIQDTSGGAPSPSNICPISGWDSVDVSVAGKNLFDGVWESGTINSTTGAEETATGFSRSVNKIKVKPNTSYAKIANGTVGVRCFDENHTYIGNVVATQNVFTTLANTSYIRLVVSNGLLTNPIGINTPSTATDYHAYQGQTITTTLPQTVYGGTLDVVSGVLTVDRAMVTLNTASMDNSEDYPGWRNSGVRNLMGAGLNNVYNDAQTNVGRGMGVNTIGSNDILLLLKSQYDLTQSQWQALAIDVQIIVPLATPTTIQLTPQQIDSLLGRNSVWADSGDVTVEYIADTKLYIQKVIG